MNKTLRVVPILLAAVAAAVLAFAREDHRPYRDLEFPDCAECHKGSGVAPNHGGGWLEIHRVFSANPDTVCWDCHDQRWCQDCHQGGGLSAELSQGQWKRDIEPKTHRSDWLSIHPIEARADPNSCERCHDRRDCQNCHGAIERGALTVKSHQRVGNTQVYTAGFPEPHASEARRELSSCQSCHPGGEVCLPCHSARAGLGVNPHPKDFNAGRIRSRSNNRTCPVCHDF